MPNFRSAAQFGILIAPRTQKIFDLGSLELREREIVFGTIANDTRDAVSGPIQVEAGSGRNVARRIGTHARMVIGEDKNSSIVFVPNAADTHVAGAKVTVFRIFGRSGLRCDRFAEP